MINIKDESGLTNNDMNSAMLPSIQPVQMLQAVNVWPYSTIQQQGNYVVRGCSNGTLTISVQGIYDLIETATQMNGAFSLILTY